MLFNQHAQNTPLNLKYTVALFMAAGRGNRRAESPDQMSGAPADLSFSDGEMKSELKESKVNPNSAAREGLSFTVNGTLFPHRLAAETNNRVGNHLGRTCEWKRHAWTSTCDQLELEMIESFSSHSEGLCRSSM